MKAIFFKNARLLGALSGRGVFHTALIPLFHNRAQQLRRNDNGAYLWEHGGRLDQWLDSCQFPNFGASGPRDFEHLVQMNNSQKLRHYIGEHLLSFTLVIGSYFRNKAPDRRGKDEHQLPLDTRDLFSPPLFIELLSGVCKAYFKGLANKSMAPEFDLCSFELVEALIQVMGKDKDMEEVLRVHDQNQMSQTYFSQFLKQRGISTPPLKGKQDIVLETGPHLGGFNQAISVPELIDALFRFSAILVSTCFLNENKWKA
ncbi:MAG: SidJ-related pseudokinase [Desulfobacter sp.]|nr:SidJ-related pseudokinase [Desulfobacter sp.]WDP88086.1 MAG: SidJ-related pseudokinase [Desulfobacter sp.]